eukprot:8344120-Karenia_brevis.AAC.1
MDSQVAVSVVAKGRSSSIQLNTVLRRLAALCVTGNLRIIAGWCKSDTNPADHPSRKRWRQNQF